MSRLGLLARVLLREAAHVELRIARGGDGLAVLKLHGERCAHEFVRGVLVEILGEQVVAKLAAEVAAAAVPGVLKRLASEVWCDGTGYVAAPDATVHGYEPRACGGCVNCISDDEPIHSRIPVSQRPGELLVKSEGER